MPAGKFAGRLPERPRGRTIVLGAGKGAAAMAAAFEDAWDAPCEGLVVTRYDHGAPTRMIEVAEAGHPVPDDNGVKTARRILALAESAGPDDLVVALMSGGASSLLALPAPGITLERKQALTRQLLASGCPIGELNRFRMALSAIKGGRLAKAAAPAAVVTYVISDVPGDDPALVGSGPTIVQDVSAKAALAIAERYGIEIDADLRGTILANEITGALPPSPVHVIATPMQALNAAAEQARSLGLHPLILGDRIEGEAREVAKVLAGIALSCRHDGTPASAPLVILSGGETTVTVRGDGKGGRNAEFLLSLSEMLSQHGGFAALAADTDGIDGIETNAGAWFGAQSTETAGRLGLSPGEFLARNDAYSFFARLGTLIETGPTRTNVNDFRAIIVR